MTDIYTTPIETIFGQIVAKANNYQAVPDGAGGRRIIKNAKVRNYERMFAEQCQIYADRRIDTPFELIVAVYYTRRSFDLDNSLKTLLDCLQQVGAITNDNLCTRIVADKLVDAVNPRVEFQIIPEVYQPQLFLC